MILYTRSKHFTWTNYNVYISIIMYTFLENVFKKHQFGFFLFRGASYAWLLKWRQSRWHTAYFCRMISLKLVWYAQIFLKLGEIVYTLFQIKAGNAHMYGTELSPFCINIGLPNSLWDGLLPSILESSFLVVLVLVFFVFLLNKTKLIFSRVVILYCYNWALWKSWFEFQYYANISHLSW